ncbi:MAG: ATP-binding protein [Leptolyngbyaceae bacterium]|nr:ATP-binding protein [Leptolyngbyaceae bacterium]
MLSVHKTQPTTSEPHPLSLTTHSTIGHLALADQHLDAQALGKDAMQMFSNNPGLPGLLLTDGEKMIGMISRQKLLEQMSRPYSLELFLERPMYALYPFVRTQFLTLHHTVKVADAVLQALQRPQELLYEPIVVDCDTDTYKLLDIHQLLIAQADVHRLTTQLLNKKTQDHLAQTEKMSSLGRMIAGVSHEIKNPVNCVSGNLEFLKKYIEDLFVLISTYRNKETIPTEDIEAIEKKVDLEFLLDDLPKLIESMALASERMVEIVSSLRNFSRMDHEKTQAVDIHRYLDGTLLILDSRIKAGIHVEKNYGNLPLVTCYPGQISQVFINIISNSIDALTEKQSARELRGETESERRTHKWTPTIQISTDYQCSENSKEIRIQLRDNGDGIPDEVRSRIFEPFFTTKSADDGTGLGLFISHQIITEKHHGRIHVESSPETGTLFEITLPC